MIDKNALKSIEVAKAWSENGDRDIRKFFMNNKLMDDIGNISGKCILDAGCGDGRFLNYIIEGQAKEIHALDINSHLIDIAKKNNPSVNFKVHDLDKEMPFSKEFFDIIISYNSLMHVENLDNVMREFYRILKIDGKLHIIVTHPLYQLFVIDENAKNTDIKTKLKSYNKKTEMVPSTLSNCSQFHEYRRSISSYLKSTLKNGFKIKNINEISLPSLKEMGLLNNEIYLKYKEREGFPIFLQYCLEK